MYDVPNFGSFPDAYQHMLNDGLARVASTSWSCTAQDGCSSSFMNSLDSIFSNMVGQGWTLVAAQGDRGATDDLDNDLDVAFPGSDVNVVAAGGTTGCTPRKWWVMRPDFLICAPRSPESDH
jgi:subtilase family serine protease